MTVGTEVISPEGVEERIEYEVGLRITLTGGGKYRVYAVENGEASATSIHDTREAAITAANAGLMLCCAFKLNPKKTTQIFSEMLKRVK